MNGRFLSISRNNVGLENSCIILGSNKAAWFSARTLCELAWLSLRFLNANLAKQTPLFRSCEDTSEFSKNTSACPVRSCKSSAISTAHVS